jgi:hypothetical protein
MKNIYVTLLALFTMAVAFAEPPVIQNPTPFITCDDNNDGFAQFDLVNKNAEILGALNPSLYSVRYYETQLDAEVDANNLFPFGYTNINPYNHTVYVRVTEIADESNYATTTLDLIVSLQPWTNDVPDIVIHETPFDGLAQFDLSVNTPIISGPWGWSVMYFTNAADAQTGANAIPPGSFFNTSSPQTIWYSITEMSTGCYAVGNFNLVVLPTDVVYIPDAAFKNKLITDGVDANTDGEIQFSEAAVVTAINVDAQNVARLTGVESFPALQTLSARNNILHATVNLNGLSNLVNVDMAMNNPGVDSLSVVGLNSLKILRMSGNKLQHLNVAELSSLEELYVDYNYFDNLDVSMITSLKRLECNFNFDLISLTLGNQPNMTYLDCANNYLSSLNVSGLTLLQSLNCANNQLTSLNFSGLLSLVDVTCSGNQLTSLDLSNSPELQYLVCGNNLLTSLDLSNLPELIQLICWHNQLTTLNCNANHQLQSLGCYSNLLETVYIKNGMDEAFDPANWLENPTLTYICADESQVGDIIANAGGVVSVNSYCSMEPGGDYNTITGVVRYDADNDGCDTDDPVVPYQYLDITGPEGNGYAFANAGGVYNLYVGSGSFLIFPNLDNNSYFTLNLPVSVNFPVVDNSVQTVDFCLVPNGVHHDVEVHVEPMIVARPGFIAWYKIVYRNKGNQMESGSVVFNFESDVLQLVSAVPAQNATSAGQLTFDYTNLPPFESREIIIAMQVNAPTDTPAINVGDVLDFSAQISPVVADETPDDNDVTYNETVIGSYDPNNMICLEGNLEPVENIGEYLHYVANFENTGTDVAVNIVVKTEFDNTQFDVPSLRILHSSNPAEIHVTGNKAEYIFNDINLAIGGHGNILLKIKTQNNLNNGDMVANRADIFFDYNLPITTNDAETTFQLLSVGGPGRDESIAVYPNPTGGQINISAATIIQSVQLYDIQGRLLQTAMRNESTVSIDISDRQSGIYFVKVISENGISVQKVVKN